MHARICSFWAAVILLAGAAVPLVPTLAQVPPSAEDLRAYSGLHAAAAAGDVVEIKRLMAAGADANARDGHRRTPLHVAAHAGRHEAARALLQGGADPNALDAQRYDVITIAAVRDEVEMLELALEFGGNPKAVTSPYNGTALIAAAHLGHAEIVRTLIAVGAPLDHVNNLGWTAVMESVVLGNGGRNHAATLEALAGAGANVNIPDPQGRTPLAHARARGFTEMVRILEHAGGR